MFQQLERVYEHDDRTHHHDREVDGRETSHHLGHLRIFEEDEGQQCPDDDGRDDATGRGQHLLTEDHVVPLRLRLAGDLCQQGHEETSTEPPRQPCQQEGHDHEDHITHHRDIIARQSCQTDQTLKYCLYRFHHFFLFLVFVFVFLTTFFSTFGCGVSNRLGSLITAQRRSWKSRPSAIFITPWFMMLKAST